MKPKPKPKPEKIDRLNSSLLLESNWRHKEKRALHIWMCVFVVLGAVMVTLGIMLTYHPKTVACIFLLLSFFLFSFVAHLRSRRHKKKHHHYDPPSWIVADATTGKNIHKKPSAPIYPAIESIKEPISLALGEASVKDTSTSNESYETHHPLNAMGSSSPSIPLQGSNSLKVGIIEGSPNHPFSLLHRSEKLLNERRVESVGEGFGISGSTEPLKWVSMSRITNSEISSEQKEKNNALKEQLLERRQKGLW